MKYQDILDIVGLNSHEKQITATVKITSVEDFRVLFSGGLTDTQRTNFAKHIPSTAGQENKIYNLDFLEQIVSHVYANTELRSAEAQKFVDEAFPIEIDVLTGENVTISSDMLIGPGARPYLINADTLTIDGGSLTVTSTALTIRANKLVFTQNQKSAKSYHIGILGQTGMNGSKGPDGMPYDSPAQAGSSASAPTPGICSGASNGDGGLAGSSGAEGGSGQNGKDGLANLPANISIAALDESAEGFVIFTQSGMGGDGGDGGTGGSGQIGGHGGQGCNSGCEGTDGGNGGAGGNGGVGGNGGNGGSGADGNPIVITFPTAGKGKLNVISMDAKPGTGGRKGVGGSGGRGGFAGSGGKHKSGGASGSQGKFGADGKAGPIGQHDGSPGNVTYHFT